MSSSEILVCSSVVVFTWAANHLLLISAYLADVIILTGQPVIAQKGCGSC